MRGNTYTQPVTVGLGYQEIVRPDPPGAGNFLTLNMEGRWYSRLVAAVFTLTTSGVAGNRAVTLELCDGNGLAFVVNGAAVVQIAGAAQRYVGSFSRSQAEFAANTDTYFPLEPVFLEGGTSVRIRWTAADPGDALTLVRLTFERFSTDPEQGQPYGG